MVVVMFSLIFMIFNNINKNFKMMYFQSIMFVYVMFLFISYPLNSLILFMNLYYSLGVDFYSWGLIMLSLWIVTMMIMTSEKFIYQGKYYMGLIYLILIFLLMSFYSMNIMWFYIYFESSLIPVFLLILGWGYQINRIQAGLYMMLYTLFGSMPLLLMIFSWYKMNFSLDMNIWYSNYVSFYTYLMMIMGFLIKMPMYFLHLWLPKAHVEAPVMGSMVLAGVMLKLGSYGLLRVMLMLSMNYLYNNFFIVFGVLGGLYSSFICLNQVDMKILVAYSSVVHMSLLMAGLFTMMNFGFLGGYLMMISHGLCSSGLFYLVNINYERLMSRSLYINKGMINYLPSLSLMWFLLISSNLSFPPSLNLFSEIFLVISIIEWMENMWVLMIFLMFFSALYSLYLYSFSQQGKFIKVSFFMGVKLNEFMILLLHWVPLNVMFIMINIFL